MPAAPQPAGVLDDGQADLVTALTLLDDLNVEFLDLDDNEVDPRQYTDREADWALHGARSADSDDCSAF